jgi:hypothetical protein
MTTTRESAVNLLKVICDTIVEAVKAGGPLGVPGGTLYAALMVHGCTLQQFETFMDVLVSAGKLTRRGDLYFAK